MANVKYAREIRADAKRRNLRLATISITGRGGDGYLTWQGVVSDDEANLIDEFLIKLINEETTAPPTE